jgi:hypothetical protein
VSLRAKQSDSKACPVGTREEFLDAETFKISPLRAGRFARNDTFLLHSATLFTTSQHDELRFSAVFAFFTTFKL